MARKLKPCGTPAAFRRHRYHNEEPCEACLEAYRAHNRAVAKRLYATDTEFRKSKNKTDNEYNKARYREDPVYREAKKKYGREYHYRRKRALEEASRALPVSA